ncbi:hypothetical protein [Streptomyces sp. NBC_01373]|uniref:hypothetical protein n=1 Tax=unclassified Streptomyces TaxID=2593676 RepID=UPI0022512FBD|nr:hypothetical protein [Streptomyces sp. NBC_01373]MCX4706927.1 hypothetical protein [Streptomyces sp. NBC_01373]
MVRAADAGSGSEAGEAGAPLRGARTNGHLARVTALAVAALIAAQWLAVAAGLTAR